MKILAIIPARGGSKGVPGKNSKLLGGKPLLAYTSEIAMQCKKLSKVIVSTDAIEIAKIANELEVEVPFMRPAELALDTTPTIDVILHALEWYKNQGVFFDSVCLLQVTSPFRTVEFLDNAIEKFIKSGCDSLLSVQKVPNEYNPHWTFEEDANGNLKIATGESEIITRRQDLPTTYHRDGSIYITKTNVLINQKSLYGKSSAYIESDPEFYVNIDTLDDWKKAEIMLQNLLK